MALIIGAALAACDDGAPLTPSRLEVQAGDGQSGVVGSALAVQPSVRVLTTAGKPVPRVTVSFEVTTGGGSIVQASVVSDARGVASAGVWTLGTRSGANTLRASVTGTVPLSISATGNAGAPSTIAVVNGGGQRGTVGTALALPPTVRVGDVFDNPVAGVTVVFNVTTGGGSVMTASAPTQADGTASAGAWTLGGLAGDQTVTASLPSVAGSGAVFTARGEPAEASRLIVKVQPASSATNGAPLSGQPVVQVADAFGNAVARASLVVTASAGNAAVQNAQALTDAAGAAVFSGLALTGIIGSYTLRFTSPALSPVDAIPVTLGPGAASRLGILAGPPPLVLSGITFTTQPVLEVQDESGNRVGTAATGVTASVASGNGALTGNLTAIAVQGIATFSNLAYAGQGSFQIRFSSTGLQSVTTAALTVDTNLTCTGATALALDYALGQSARFRPDVAVAPQCLQFDLTRNRDQQYLVMIENMPRTGAYQGALFPGLDSGTGLLQLTVAAAATTGNVVSNRRVVRDPAESLPPGFTHAWDFGQGKIYEYTPREPPGGAPKPVLLRAGDRISINGAEAPPDVGDTLIVYLVGIPRLSIQDGNQRAVVRYVSNELVIAEDVRLATMPRGNGAFNTPLTPAFMDSIAAAYAAHSRVQADLLFNGRYNQATEAAQPPRIIAVHTLMPADNIWGYTFSSSNVFAWDYWVSSNGSTKGLAQHRLRNAHNLFMHEIAHIRHWGLLERANRQSLRGNMWLVEGFARFSERLPIASYLLNNSNPSRTGNVTLPLYPEFNNTYFRDDVPTYLNVSSPMFDGYASSSYVFDYLADQVALSGGNWRTALSDFLLKGGLEPDLDATVNTLLPGLTFQQLFTRARLALYLDDIGTAGLASWTQYHQFNLRTSRPPGASGTSFDPRNAWARILPGTAFNENRLIGPGAAFGYLIDGSAATANARVTFDFVPPVNAVISVTRIR